MSDAPFSPVEDAFSRYLPNFDVDIPKAVLTTWIANRIDTDPVWLMLVGPASHGKGTTLDPLRGIDKAHMMSKLTPQTFLSGSYSPKGDDPSLLNRLNDLQDPEKPLYIVCKELGTLLETDPNARGAIFAQMREIHDGYINASYGTGVTREWEGKACFIVGFTNAIDMYSSFDGLLGERFLKLRFKSIDDPAALALEAMNSSGSERERKVAIHEAYRKAIDAGIENLPGVELSAETKTQLAHLSAAVVTLRTPVSRNRYRKDAIQFHPKPESPTRIGKSFHSFASALAAMRGERDLTDLSLVYRVAFDSVMEPRRSIFMNVVRHPAGGAGLPTRADVQGVVGGTQTKKILDDLCMVRALGNKKAESDGERGRPPVLYYPHETLVQHLESSGAMEWLTNGHAYFDEAVKIERNLKTTGLVVGSP